MFWYSVHMSTEYQNNTTAHRIALLAQKGEVLFHSHDLATLWGIDNPNTLYTTLKRYTQQQLLHRIYKGLYALVPVAQIDPLILGCKALHRYAYVSTESILFREGIINQATYAFTFISDCSRHFSIGEQHYLCRQMQDAYLFHTAGITKQGSLFAATIERAVADLLYYVPSYHFDATAAIDWDGVRSIQQEIGYQSS